MNPSVNKLLIPNTTQVPNVLLDEIIPKLTCAPVRVLLAIIRLTYGFQKFSDRLSLTYLSKKTGLSRRTVIDGIKPLKGKGIVVIKPGARGKGANEYSLNLNILTGKLVSLGSEQTGTSEETCTSEQIRHKVVSKSALFQTNTSKPILRAPKNRTPKPFRKDQPVEGFKEAMALYQDLFVAKVGAKPDIDGREGKILSGLLKTHGADEVKGLLTFFFKKPPDWVEAKGKFTLYTFKGNYTELLVRWKKQDVGMKEF